MRLRGILPAVVLVLALAGCSGVGGATDSGAADSGAPATAAASTRASTPASGAASDALDLVGTRWKLVGGDATVRFDGLAISVEQGGRSSAYPWSAQGDQVLIGSATSLGGGTASWLVATTAVHREGSGWTLVDGDGRTTARLVPDGSSDGSGSTNLLTAGKPGPGVVDSPSSALEGRWTVAGDVRTSITFAHGEWVASASCTTGAVGGAGVYRVLPGGRLLITRTRSPMRGCPIVDGPVTVRGATISRIALAASFRIDGDTLTLFDRSGAALGSLVRG